MLIWTIWPLWETVDQSVLIQGTYWMKHVIVWVDNSNIFHTKICPLYSHLRVDKNLDADLHLVRYFKEVIKMREAKVKEKLAN